VSTFAKCRDTTSRIGTPARRNTATVINQRVNYGSVDESIPALARTRNIHADGFPSRGGQVTRGRVARTEGKRVRNTREERHDQARSVGWTRGCE